MSATENLPERVKADLAKYFVLRSDSGSVADSETGLLEMRTRLEGELSQPGMLKKPDFSIIDPTPDIFFNILDAIADMNADHDETRM